MILVAPFEADAQLAYLNRAGIADFVITEDSDLILFGCDKVFNKLYIKFLRKISTTNVL